MEYGRTAPRVAFCVALLAGFFTTSTANAELEPWNQEQVTELAGQLHAAIRDVRRAALNEPTLRSRASTSNRLAQQYLDTLRRLEQSSNQLARRLADGADREATTGVARNIGTQLRDAQQTGRRLPLTAPQFAAIDKAVAVIDQLSPFYSDTSPLMPRVTNR